MNIGIIGAGRVGRTLGGGLAAAGHAVHYGVRNVDDVSDIPSEHGDVDVVSVLSAASASDVIILATPWAAVQDAIVAAGAATGALDGKILVDATNPIGPGLSLVLGHTDSGAEQVQRWAPGARVVKAFNTTGFENMAQPKIGAQALMMPVCGDDDSACAVVAGLARDLGFGAVLAGPLRQARLLEPLALLWISLAMRADVGRAMGFALLHRAS